MISRRLVAMKRPACKRAASGCRQDHCSGDRGGNFARVQALAEKYQPLYAALGLHPGIWKT
ncbi:hypothetical protein ACNKHR_08350 [Shigella flexneri]